MLVEDPTRTHLSSVRTVVELFESTNQPSVQPAGRNAQPAQAVVVAVDESAGLRVQVVLTLIETQENVIYASDELVPDEDLEAALDEAHLFAESMGFILDESGWSRMEFSQRLQLSERLPAFREFVPRERAKAVERKASGDPLAQVARLFAAFSLFALALSLSACEGMTAEQRGKSAEINYDLGVNALGRGDTQGALISFLHAQNDDPDLPQVHNALGMLYAFSLAKPVEAEDQFKRALALRSDFAEAENNYGAFLLSRSRFAESISHFEAAIANPLYGQRTIAECNLAWAQYKTGATDRAIASLRQALAVEPKFCKGWRQLGTVYAEKGHLDDALDAFNRYAETCPEAADAHLQLAQIFFRKDMAAEGKGQLERCVHAGHATDPNTSASCAKQLRGMGAP